MNTKDLNDFKLLFENMREQLIAKVKLDEENLANLGSGDIIEKTSNERDVQVLLKLQGRDRFMMMKIEHALEKIENKTFGQCEECDGDISLKRLLARPVATQCICCKEEQENEENQINYAHRSKYEHFI
jgi:DnaK suppressor protein